MNAAAERLTQTVIGALVIVALVACLALALIGPRFLLLDPEASRRALIDGAIVAVGTVSAACGVTWVYLRKFRFTLRALGLGSEAVEPDELRGLDRAPARITVGVLIVATIGIVASVLPGLAPEQLDTDNRVCLALLAWVVAVTASLPLYGIIRGCFVQVIQLAPEDCIREVLDHAGRTSVPARRIAQRTQLAVVVPVALVGTAVALLAHAHVRAFEARERMVTATAIAQGALEPLPGPVPMAGQMEAAAAADKQEFAVRLSANRASFAIEKKPSGRVTITVPLDVGHAVISFASTTILALTGPGIGAALVAMLLAALLGRAVGRSVALDLRIATRKVELLGTENVLHRQALVVSPARYEIVAALDEAIERLAERLRVFASAQEQAIEAKDAAHRMRGLLFASVSHDLKNSLNAVLGFAELINSESLVPAQTESLEVIKSRGRELLMLIETILDTGRIEAGQLVLHKRSASLDDLVSQAVRAAAEIVGSQAAAVRVDLDTSLPMVEVDPQRLIEALATLVCHSLRTTTKGTVQVRTAWGLWRREAAVEIEAPTRVIPAAELLHLMMSDGESTMPRNLGGLALGLALARSLLVLHGGGVEVLDTPEGVMLRAHLPVTRKS